MLHTDLREEYLLYMHTEQKSGRSCGDHAPARHYRAREKPQSNVSDRCFYTSPGRNAALFSFYVLSAKRDEIRRIYAIYLL